MREEWHALKVQNTVYRARGLCTEVASILSDGAEPHPSTCMSLRSFSLRAEDASVLNPKLSAYFQLQTLAVPDRAHEDN